MYRPTLTALAAVAVLTACGHDKPSSDARATRGPDLTPAGATTPVAVPTAATNDAMADGHVTRDEFQAAEASFAESLARLDALEILDVGALIAVAPENAYSCYGPCEDRPEVQAWMQAHVREVDRFVEFVDTAARIAAETAEEDSGVLWAQAQAAAHALDELKIIDIKSIHRGDTKNCYVGQCPGDHKRAAVLTALAKAFEKS